VFSARDPRARRGSALWATFVAGLLGAGAAGCGRKADDGKHFGTTARAGKEATAFYLNNHDEPEYLDPGLSTESAGSTLLMDLFEGLTVQHPEDLRPTQGAAIRYDKSADNRFFRFHLRPEAKWSDGKPVVAGDFVYAWRRVLTPATGARMATIMYPLKNGRLFHQKNLKALQETTPLRAAPSDEAGGAQLEAGQPLRILQRSPAKIQLVPLKAVDDTPLSYAPGGDDTPAKLTRGEREMTKATPATSAVLLGAGAPTKCNGAPDRWYRVRQGEVEGWLPGCALAADPAATWALVEVFEDKPTFRPAAKPKPQPEPTPETDNAPGESDDKGEPDEEPPPAGQARPDAEPAPERSSPKPVAPKPVAAAPEPRRGFVRLKALVDDPSLIGVRAVDDHTLEVELEEPTPFFLELCATVTYSPVRRDVIEKFAAQGRVDLWYRPENIVTNGAYVLTGHKFRYEMTFERNPHYHHHDALKIHRITWLAVPDYHATMNLYETGEIDYIGSNVSLPTAYMDRLSTYDDFDRSVWLATYWYEFNIKQKPVDDVRVRKALNLAVDKQLLIDKVTRGGQEPATHIVPDATGSGYRALAEDGSDPMGKALFADEEWGFNPAKARALLEEAGYPVEKKGDGFHAPAFPPLEILYNTSEGHRAIAVAMQDMWKRHLGISVQLRNEEWKVMIKNLRDGHFQVARFGWVADYNHPHTYLDTYLSYSQNNWTNWSDPKFDHLVEQGAATADPVESMRVYRQAERLAMDAMSRMPLYFYTKSTLIKPYVKGYFPNPSNRHKVQWMWIDPNWQAGGENVPAYPPEELAAPDLIEPGLIEIEPGSTEPKHPAPPSP
jgi:oligopeptide transport system substrate-binding protein